MWPEDIEARIRADFPNDADKVFAAFEELKFIRIRDHLARSLLVLAEGSMVALKGLLDQALEEDMKEVIHWAEHDDEDKRIRNLAKGFDTL